MSIDFKRASFFNKYIKKTSTHKDHAVLSASGSERWLGCPASIRLSKGRPSVDSPAGIEGTYTHTLLQFFLENGRESTKLLQAPESSLFKKHINYDENKHKSAWKAAVAVWDEMRRIKDTTGKWPELRVEHKVELEDVGFGTTDIMLYQPFGLLHIMDFKNGKYKVEAKENTQGLYYGVGAANSVGWDFSDVWITIIQPNAIHAKGPIRTWKTTPERLEKAHIMFKRGAAATRKKDSVPVPNHKYCYFCPARPICPAHIEKRDEKLNERFKPQ